jgi:hypothetical protein
MLLKKVRDAQSDLLLCDEELKSLFTKAVLYSKLFYLKTITLIQTKNISCSQFEKYFSVHAQPIGQSLIEVIMKIKLRIKIAKIKAQNKKTANTSIFSNFKITKNSFINLFVRDIFFKVNILPFANYKLAKLLKLILALACLWLINSYLIYNVSSSYKLFLNILYCLSIGAIITLLNPVKKFGNIDIYGKNIVAYRYQIFFNSISNKKVYYIYALQNSNTGRHEPSQSI